jgi:hypothetical protein
MAPSENEGIREGAHALRLSEVECAKASFCETVMVFMASLLPLVRSDANFCRERHDRADRPHHRPAIPILINSKIKEYWDDVWQQTNRDRKLIYSTEILGILYRVFVRPLLRVESDSEGITNAAHSIIAL